MSGKSRAGNVYEFNQGKQGDDPGIALGYEWIRGRYLLSHWVKSLIYESPRYG